MQCDRPRPDCQTDQAACAGMSCSTDSPGHATLCQPRFRSLIVLVGYALGRMTPRRSTGNAIPGWSAPLSKPDCCRREGTQRVRRACLSQGLESVGICPGVHQTRILYADSSPIGTSCTHGACSAPLRTCQSNLEQQSFTFHRSCLSSPSAYPGIVPMVANSIRLVRCTDRWRGRPEMAVDAPSGRDDACMGTLCGVSLIRIASHYGHRKQGSSDQPRRQDLQRCHQPSPLNAQRRLGL